jgi:arabinofuranan 3-O-arabinosyltransferase
LILSFFVPFLALLASALLKWRKRSFFALLVVVGMALAVGAYPYYHPTGVSGLIKAFMSDTTAGLALRSTDRATPLLLLGLAVLLGAGVDAVVRRFGRSGLMAAAFVLVAIAGASFPLWTGSTVVDGLHQPAQPPSYVKEAASALNASHPGTRVYGMPGNNFGAYRWGDTIDTVYPGLLTRPFVTHEQQTMGSLPTADLLEAVDTPLQEGTMDPRTIAPMMSLMSVGEVLVQYDQAYETYNTPNPLQLAYDLTPTPAGLSDPVSYGKPRANVSTVPDFNEQLLALPVNQKPTAPLVSYTVAKPRPIVRAESLKTPLVVDGDSTGLVNASSIGLLANQPTVFFAGTLDTNTTLKKSVLKPGANLVVTDTNRKQGYRWNGIQDNAGYTETAAETTAITNLLTPDPFNSPLNLFPKAPADAQSTTVFNDDIAWVEASSYGSLTQYFNDERPAAALDGDPATAWADSQFPTGQWWSVEFSHPKTMGSINLAQIQAAHPKQVITKVTLSFDYENPVTVELGAESRTPTGQTIDFSPRTFSNLRITIDASYRTKYHVTASYENVVGFSEVRFPSLPAVTETVAMPQDLLRSVGATSTADPLTLSMTRLRGSGFPERYDAELAIDRSFWLPTTRTFALTGQARIDATSSDETVDHDVGRPDAQGGGVSASSSSRLTGDVATGASAAIDGDPSTTWTSAFGVSADGQWLQYSLARPITFDSLDLQIVADGRHSVPTEVTVSAGGVSDKAKLAPVADGKEAGTIVKVPVALPTALTGQTIRVTIDAARMETTKDYYTQSPITKPFAVAELGIEGLASSPVPTAIPSTCRDDLLSVDGAPVWVAVSGSSTTALARRPLSIALCGPDAGGLALGPGSHTLRSARGQVAGFNLDTVDLSSAAGGGPAVISAEGDVPVAVPAVAPKVTVDHQTSTAMRLTISHIPAESSAFDLVLGQSINSGWQASIAGQSLGTPFLVDGFANGWQVDPSVLGSADHTGTVTVSLKWAPQNRVNIALIISALVIVACLLLAFVPRRRRRHARRGGDISPPGIDRSEAGGSVRMAVDEEPTLAPLFHSDEAPARWVSATVIAVLIGLAAGLIAPPLTGVFVGVATLVVLRVPRLRLVLGLVAAGLVLIAAAYIVIEQVLHSTLPNGGWPTDFGQASAIVWAGIMFLMADAVIEVVNRRRAGDPHRELPADSVDHDYEDPVSRR